MDTWSLCMNYMTRSPFKILIQYISFVLFNIICDTRHLNRQENFIVKFWFLPSDYQLMISILGLSVNIILVIAIHVMSVYYLFGL